MFAQVSFEHRWRWVMLTALVAITITTLSLWPVAAMPKVPGGDKVHHLLAYSGLMIASYPLGRYFRSRLYLALCWVALGIAIEFIQPYTNRHFEVADMVADSLGVALGWVLARWPLQRLLYAVDRLG